MNNYSKSLRDRVYDLEVTFEEISMLIHILKDFGEYNSDLPDAAEKMHFLAGLLSEKSQEYKLILGEFIPAFHNEMNTKQ